MAFNLGFLGFKKREDKHVRSAYDRLVAQARLPVFYLDYEVEDSLTGRFDMIVLHTFLFFHRMKGEGAREKAFGQALFDTFIEDLDRSLREMGVGYQAVPKRMKKMGEAFYGRVAVYDAALESDDLETLAEALSRNIFPDEEERPQSAAWLAAYMNSTAQHLAEIPAETLIDEGVDLLDPTSFVIKS